MLLVLVFSIVVSAYYIKSFLKDDSSIVAKVNGYPIYNEEFQQRVNEKKAEVFNYFSKKYKVEDSRTFWSTSFEGEVPNEMVRKKAFDECIRIKVQQIWAKDQGLIKDISYRTFLKDLKTENRRRTKALKNNEIIYGPEQYGEVEYFSYRFINLVIKLKEKLSEKELRDNPDFKAMDNKYEAMVDELVDKMMIQNKFS